MRTDDDDVDERNGSVNASIQPETGYNVGDPSSVTVSVRDNDDDEPTTPSSDPEVTISASAASVTEGQSVEFTVTANPAPASDLTVDVEVTQDGSFIDRTPPESVTISAGRSTTSFTVQTDDDGGDESHGSVTGSIQPGTGYEYDVGSPSSVTVSVLDNDESTAPSPSIAWTTTLTSEFDDRFDEYGYYIGDDGIGSLIPPTFEYDGVTHTVYYIIWYEPGEKVEFRVDRCLKYSDFVSLSIGSTTYSNPNRTRYSGAECDENSALRQKFEFHNVTSNPLSTESSYQITVTLNPPVTGIVPGRVPAPTVEPRDESLRVSWSEPYNRGSEIEEYEISVSPGSTSGQGASGGATGASVTGPSPTAVTSRFPGTGSSGTILSLRANSSYAVRVRAHNSVGWGEWSLAAESVTGLASRVGSANRFGLRDDQGQPVSDVQPRGLAWDGTNLYLVDDSTDALYTLSTSTGEAVRVGSLRTTSGETIHSPRSLSWDGVNLWMLTEDALYWPLDRTTGSATLFKTLGTGITDASGIAWKGTPGDLWRGERLYMVDRETDALYIVNTDGVAGGDQVTRVSTSTSQFGASIDTPAGIVWVGSDLHMAADGWGALPWTLYRLDETTGAASSVGPLGVDAPTDLAWDGSNMYLVDDDTDTLYTVSEIPAPTTTTPTGSPSYLPNAGDLYYNGGDFADAFLRWDNPSWVRDGEDCATDPKKCSTYEHDLKLEWSNDGGWFDVYRLPVIGRLPPPLPIPAGEGPFCTTWSNLPEHYDDCNTAGVNSAEVFIQLSFGTYKAPDIESGLDYYGFWRFKNQRRTGSTTGVKLYGQEGMYGRGTWKNYRCLVIVANHNWCVDPVSAEGLLPTDIATTWTYGTPNYISYSRP